MTYWDCNMTYCNLPTPPTQYDLLGLQYDLLQPTHVLSSMAYQDCSMTYCPPPSMTYCDQPTHHPV